MESAPLLISSMSLTFDFFYLKQNIVMFQTANCLAGQKLQNEMTPLHETLGSVARVSHAY